MRYAIRIYGCVFSGQLVQFFFQHNKLQIIRNDERTLLYLGLNTLFNIKAMIYFITNLTHIINTRIGSYT